MTKTLKQLLNENDLEFPYDTYFLKIAKEWLTQKRQNWLTEKHKICMYARCSIYNGNCEICVFDELLEELKK